MPDRQRIIAGERPQVRIHHRSLHDRGSQRIGPVQYIETDSLLRRGLHRIRHRAGVGVEARAGVLHVKDQRVEPLQHAISRPLYATIEA